MTAGARQAPAPDLRNPALFTEKAPPVFEARVDATFGLFIVRVTREWAPNGADRFYNLVKSGYYSNSRFHRVVKDSVVQFGIHIDPAISLPWALANIPPDRARMSNTRGRLTFAMAPSAPDSRTTQVFINLKDNSRALDLDGFAAFGEVITSMVPITQIYDKYGESLDPARIYKEGAAYLFLEAPHLDYIKSMTLIDK